ncbi:alpha/beta-hydrolase [Testicularia cyperi]|uniref:Carboxylic ester hydrolase n=1 Tax=Testicularia cyperi TaxID=1882483 RepID=A0A317XXP2_9BASI|nr:alpha/beta-hydrolase [Testicularia cyperi]
MRGNLVTLAATLAGLAAQVSVDAAPLATKTPLSTGVRLLYQNDLDWTRAVSGSRQAGYLLLTNPMTASAAASACQSLGETLISSSSRYNEGLQAQLSYLVYDRTYKVGQTFWTRNKRTISIASSGSSNNLNSAQADGKTKNPALCTQSAPWKTTNTTDTSPDWQITVRSNNVQFTGYRDALSFRFLAVPYANPVQRFAYSTVYDHRAYGSDAVNALETGRAKQCPQRDGFYSQYTEQCLVTDIFTPYLPSASEVATDQNLKPIFVFIHGGGYTSGSGLDYTFDGGNLASRGDVVVLTVNYRLGSLGHLAYNEQIRGNYGLGDLVTVLKWIQLYGKGFGGDPNRVTIGGQSAGAQHVENLLASPAAAGLFHRAIVFSGKGHDSSFVYPTLEQSAAGKGGAVVKAVGCDTASNILTCLRSKSVNSFLQNSMTSIVQDGTYITSPRLDMRKPVSASGHVNRVPVIWGTLRDELASLGTVPSASQQDLKQALTIAGVSATDSQTVLNNPAIFPVETYGVQNLSVTVNTDVRYRCGIQAMAYASAVNDVFPSVYAYFYDQRAYQIPNYDPNSACQPRGGNLDPSAYYMCHSGDLMTIFHTAGSGFRLPYRDEYDLPWMASIIDQFSSFIRTGSPAPRTGYLRARGAAYASSLQRTTGDRRWTALTSNSRRGVSFGPVQQKMISVNQKGAQCRALGRAIDYIATL